MMEQFINPQNISSLIYDTGSLIFCEELPKLIFIIFATVRRLSLYLVISIFFMYLQVKRLLERESDAMDLTALIDYKALR